MILKLSILLFALATSYGNKPPSLSDPLGLNEGAKQNGFTYLTKINYVKGSVWPKPQQEARENVYYTLSPETFTFTTTGQTSDVLTDAFTRYKKHTFPDSNITADATLKQITGIQVDVLYPYKPISLMSDESYTLVVTAPTATIKSNTVWGALKGLETFSQVVHQNDTDFYHAQKNKITDFPRFHHRGFLIDTSRHFVSVKVILEFIDALAYSKFNVLHWHIVDDNSFPYVSRRFPTMHGQGAWNNKTSIYTPEDIKKIINYARLRGVRVIPEFDTPGHVRSWGSIAKLLTPCYSGSKPNGQYGPIDPSVDSNYEFLKAFFAEVAEVFDDAYIHLGGDEVPFGCWQSNPNIASWMQGKGMGRNFSLLEQHYEQKLLDIISGLGKKYVIWQEVVDNQVKVRADTVVNVWRGGWQNEMARVTKLGYRTILSSCWYLNYISYGSDWQKYYKCDPQNFKGTPEQLDKVIGGTGCMWGEYVDGVNLVSRTWARALSIGERLWSSKSTTNLADATMRIWEHRCRYLRRGLNADPVIESQYCRHEYMND